jgi:hypothetical protein
VGTDYAGEQLTLTRKGDLSPEIVYARCVTGHNVLVTIWVIAQPKRFGVDDVNRYLDSLKIY